MFFLEIPSFGDAIGDSIGMRGLEYIDNGDSEGRVPCVFNMPQIFFGDNCTADEFE